jgi:D-3-phosphoglycerate dehydrogenase
MYKVLVTARIFGHLSDDSFDIFKNSGFELADNPYREKGLSGNELIELIGGVHGLLTGVDQVTAKVINAADELKVISKFGTGVDNIDVAAATHKGVVVTNAPGMNSDAVADMTFSLILSIARRIPFANDQVRKGNWPLIVGTEICNKTLGLIGLGQIGKRVAMRAGGFNMKILAYELLPDEQFVQELGIKLVPLNRLFQESDFVSIHVPFTSETEDLIKTEQLEMMKPTAYLINTARGGIVDENALYHALESGEIAGAAFDVFKEEPLKQKALIELDSFIATPHISPFTKEAIENAEKLSAQNIIDVLKGQFPPFIVNPEVLNKG